MPKLDLSDLRQRDVEDFWRTKREIRAGLSNITSEGYSDRMVKFAASLHKEAGEMKAENLQAVMREFSNGLLMLRQRWDNLTSIEDNGISVRAMARLGWFGEDVDETDVGDMRPGEVKAAAAEFDNLLAVAYEIPKN